MFKMKNVMVAVLAGACLLSAGFSSQAMAQASSSAATSKKVVKKTATKHHETRHETRRRRTERASTNLLPKSAPIPDGAEKWSCDDNESIFIAGNMKRDQILSVVWDGRTYKLPREATTTGADRFYDPASGMDLVVIPTKAMLFMDRGDRTRLADECKTQVMTEQNAPAPTQSNELLLNQQKRTLKQSQ